MNVGYDKPLYLLPFDHRHSYVKSLFKFEPPLESFVAAARCDGRDTVGCIVLARGADEAQVRRWLVAAAGVPGFIGFAVGRTTFWDALVGWQAQTLTRAEAVSHIAGRLREWVDVFEAGQMPHRAGPG